MKELYHISFDRKLEGVWEPKQPDGMTSIFKSLKPGTEGFRRYPEPRTKRISLAPTIEGCFLGVYENIKGLFDIKNYPYLIFAVYKPKITSKTKMVSNLELTEKNKVWDAHITGESWIVSKVEMELVGLVEIKSPKGTKTLDVYPFGNTDLPLITTTMPAYITYKWLKQN